MKIKKEPIDHPSAWRASDFASGDAFAFDLEKRHLNALDAALAVVVRKGKGLTEIEDSDFALPAIAQELARLRRELLTGRGLVLIRGFPVERYTLAEMSIIYWGLGTHFGRGVLQSSLGDRLGYVVHDPESPSSHRGYRSNKELNLHTDSEDIVSLLCIRQAKSGGESRLVSAVAIHNEMAAMRPDLLEPLYAGFRYHWSGAHPPDGGPITDYRIPIFCWSESFLSTVFLRGHMTDAARLLGEPMTERQIEALDLFQQLGARRDLMLEFQLEPGSAFFVNNFTVLHARNSFEDWPEKERRRLLLRLWLEAHEPRPVHPDMRRYYDDSQQAYRSK